MDQFTDDKGRALLAEGTRVRSRQHPDLTGYVKHYEWNKPGNSRPSPTASAGTILTVRAAC